MDYVDWCELVLLKLNEATQASSSTRMYGVHWDDLLRTIYGETAEGHLRVRTHDSVVSVDCALRDLMQHGLVQERQPGKYLQLLRDGREHIDDKISLWESICRIKLTTEQARVLHLVNQYSPFPTSSYICPKEVDGSKLLNELEWPDGSDELMAVAQELEEVGFVQVSPWLGASCELRTTYAGCVWGTRRAYTIDSRRIDALIAEGENTSIEWKREVVLGTASQKAEFIKDLLGLANTQTPSPRLLLIGFTKTGRYHGPPDRKLNQDTMEQLIADYISPYLNIKYDVFDYPQGQVGQITVLREATKLPYTVAKSLGNKAPGEKRIEVGDMFVRHGSQTEPPTEGERRAIIAEGERARATFV